MCYKCGYTLESWSFFSERTLGNLKIYFDAERKTASKRLIKIMALHTISRNYEKEKLMFNEITVKLGKKKQTPEIFN